MCLAITKSGKICKNKNCGIKTHLTIGFQKGKGKIVYSNEKTITEIKKSLERLEIFFEKYGYQYDYIIYSIKLARGYLSNIKHSIAGAMAKLEEVVRLIFLIPDDDLKFTKESLSDIKKIIRFLEILKELDAMEEKNISLTPRQKSAQKNLKELEGKQLENYLFNISKKFYLDKNEN